MPISGFFFKVNLVAGCKPWKAEADKQALGVSWAAQPACLKFAQLHLSNSQLALTSVGYSGYTPILSTTIDFLIRPPDTPAVLVCTVGACAQQTRSCLWYQLSVPTNRPTQPSSVGVKSSPCELSAPSSATAPPLLFSQKVRAFFSDSLPRPPTHRPLSLLWGAECSGGLWNLPRHTTRQCLCISQPGWLMRMAAGFATSQWVVSQLAVSLHPACRALHAGFAWLKNYDWGVRLCVTQHTGSPALKCSCVSVTQSNQAVSLCPTWLMRSFWWFCFKHRHSIRVQMIHHIILLQE